MATLLLLRHAEAAREPGQSDHGRALTEGGRRDARAVGAWMAEHGLAPNLVLVSDATRAQETAATRATSPHCAGAQRDTMARAEWSLRST